MSLKSEVFGFLDNAKQLCGEYPDTQVLKEILVQMRSRLSTPLRVAVVGIMKAGKSTFMNALMGADLISTGSLETTYTVCWFRYGKVPSLTVCFRDGSQMETAFGDLEKWSVRQCAAVNPRINDVKYLIIYYPAEILKTLEFIDTPGLNSIYGIDEKNTLDFLAVKGSEDTLYEAGMADAIIYAFSHTVRGFDQEILKAFHGKGAAQVSPINSVGILTKVDVTGIWDIWGENSPVETAGSVADTLMSNSGMKQLFFTILPVCAKVCEGYSQLSEDDWRDLRKIALDGISCGMEMDSGIEYEKLQDLLFDAGEFTSSTDEMYQQLGDIKSRKHLMELLGQYGILEIVRQLQQGKTPEEIGTILHEVCGIKAVEELLFSHFSSRTFLIKTQYIFNYLLSRIHHMKQERDTSERLHRICNQVEDGIDSLLSSVQPLKELRALQSYYNGQLQFQDKEEQEDFLRVTGEYGRFVEVRLGTLKGKSVAELAEIARKKVSLWNGKAASGWMVSGAYMEAASIVARSYEQIYYHLNALCDQKI